MTRRWAALTLALGLLCPTPALAEIPRTTAEWLSVYRERQARFDAVEIESHWQRLEGEKVVEEWDQKFYADDLGRLRLEELGRLKMSDARPGVGLLVDSVFAFDGAEYREFHTRWEYSSSVGSSPEARAALRLSPPKAHQSLIMSEAGDHSTLRRIEHPFRMCDHMFLPA